MLLRPYQIEATQQAIENLRGGHNPVLQLATGTGKSVIIANLAEHVAANGGRALILTHVQQLVAQNAATYNRFTGKIPAIVCASLGRKDVSGEVTFGTIQSVAGAARAMSEPDLIIIDEAHRVPHNLGEPSQYDSILRRYPRAGRVAMTATPWRMDNGIIYGDGPQFWFDRIAYNYNVPRAVADGWLCPLVGVETEIQLDVAGVAINGDFVQADVEGAQTEAWLNAVAKSAGDLAVNRKHIAVYCPTIKAARKTADIIARITGWTTAALTSDMTDDERVAVFSRFYTGEVRVLCSVDMITTGFDFPALDCIVCLRPTLSSSLWVQIQGRGTRLHPGKKNCLVLDYAGNLIRLGGVGMYETYYKEAGRMEVEAAPRKPHVKKERESLPGLTSLRPIDPMTGVGAIDGAKMLVNVHRVSAAAIKLRTRTGSQLMVQYVCTTSENARINATKFVSTEWDNQDAVDFFRSRRLAIPLPARAESLYWQMKNARKPEQVTVVKRGKYWNVVREHWV